MNALQVGVGLVLANRYFLTNELARGPVAVVWSAYDRIKDEQVALKLVHGPAAEKPPVLEVFWRSAHQMAALSHPAIVGVLNKPREETRSTTWSRVFVRRQPAAVGARRQTLAGAHHARPASASERACSTPTSDAFCIATSSQATSCSTAPATLA